MDCWFSLFFQGWSLYCCWFSWCVLSNHFLNGPLWLVLLWLPVLLVKIYVCFISFSVLGVLERRNFAMVRWYVLQTIINVGFSWNFLGLLFIVTHIIKISLQNCIEHFPVIEFAMFSLKFYSFRNSIILLSLWIVGKKCCYVSCHFMHFLSRNRCSLISATFPISLITFQHSLQVHISTSFL